jgi:hypothetical protein
MNGYEPDEMESLTGLLEELEDESDELAERRRRGRRGGFGGVSTPSGRPSYQPQPTSDLYVKKSELARAMMTVDAKIKTISEATAKVNARVNTVADQQATLAMAIKKENRARKKADAELKTTLLLTALVPLILKPPSRTITTTVNGLTQGDKVLVEESDFLKTLAPIGLALLGPQIGGLLGGLEGGGSSSSSGSSGL